MMIKRGKKIGISDICVYMTEEQQDKFLKQVGAYGTGRVDKCDGCGGICERYLGSGYGSDKKYYCYGCYWKYAKIDKNNRGTAWALLSKCVRDIYQECSFCHSKEFLQVHHIDSNWKNNELDNLIVVCRDCHIGWHLKKEFILSPEQYD